MGTNKTNEVLKYLQKNSHITSIEAINLFGATRLSAIIFNLRKRGYNITSVPKTMTDRYGKTVKFAEYTLTATMEQEDDSSSNNDNTQINLSHETNSLFRDILNDK